MTCLAQGGPASTWTLVRGAGCGPPDLLRRQHLGGAGDAGPGVRAAVRPALEGAGEQRPIQNGSERWAQGSQDPCLKSVL